MMNRIPLLVPRMPLADTLIPYLRQIDQNRWYTNFGPLNTEFERRLLQDTAPLLGPDNISTVANCTVGLELALQAFDLRPGARVLLPAITFVATATAIIRCGLVPVFADIDAKSWVLTPDIARATADQLAVDAVMPVSTFGYAHDTDEWDEFSRRTGLPVVIDAAGAYGNQRPGKIVDVVYSFHATKSFGAAEGGAVISGDARRIARIRQLANFGIDTSTGLLAGHGTNGKMSEYHCAIGLASFDEWAETQRTRRDLHTRYLAALARHVGEVVLQAKDPAGVYPLMPVALPSGIDVQAVRSQLAEAGIETRRWYAPGLDSHPALQQYPAGDLRVSNDMGSRILGLPFFIGLSDDQIARICTTLADVIRGQQATP
jgi:dTDP-4-amino-4,6-dideoxygalactose transaminase